MLKTQRKTSSRAQQRRSKPSGSNGHAPPPSASLPQRPVSALLSDAIPLFFIGRNKDGLWVARDEDGRVGGVFLLKGSALRFARDSTPPWGCATMEVPEGFELDIPNHGNPFIEPIVALLRRLRRCLRAVHGAGVNDFISHL